MSLAHSVRHISVPASLLDPAVASETMTAPLVGQVGQAIGLAQADLESHRRELTAFCYRMLGSGFEAEDAVQEAFARLVAADIEGILDDRGWLTVVTSRICFDKVRSAPRRREFGCRWRTDRVLLRRAAAALPHR